MDNRERILISWSARDIETYLFPTIYELSNHFKISVLVFDISRPDNLVNKLELMASKKEIEGYFLTPKKMYGFRYHLYLKKNLTAIKNLNFNIWLCSSEMQILEKYVYDMLIKPNTKVICMCNNLTHLFTRNPVLAKQMIQGVNVEKNDIIDTSKSIFFLRKKFIEIFRGKNFVKVLWSYLRTKKIIVFRFASIGLSKKFSIFLNRYLFPLLLTKKIQNVSQLEEITQLGDGKAFKYLFFDDLEVQAHKNLFKNNNVFLTCVNSKSSHKNHINNKILGILSGWYEQKLLDDFVLEMYIKDFIKVCEIFNTTDIDIRPHPSMEKHDNYAYQIASTMIKKGFNCNVVSFEDSLIDQSFKYICTAGFASSALRDVRFFNKSISVIGFETISKQYFESPKFAFGNSTGIDWIDSNGELVKSKSTSTNKPVNLSDLIYSLSN